MDLLLERIESGATIILDGATGTELERRGVPMNRDAWSAAAIDTHPSIVTDIHEDYIRAGADVIITNTFAAARHVLGSSGMGDQVRELNLRAVELAQRARENTADGRPVAIAGSISTFPHPTSTALEKGNTLTHKQARANYREQAELLAEGGVDLLAMEMMGDTEHAAYAVEAAVATGLPVWIGISCILSEEDSSLQLWGGETLEKGLDVLLPMGASVVTVMHTLTEHTIQALHSLMARWSGPIGAYPHSGRFVMPNWQFHDIISPEDYLIEAKKWFDMGVQIIGGCCGIGPDHIRLLKEELPTDLANRPR